MISKKRIKEVAKKFEVLSEFSPEAVPEMGAQKRAELLKIVRWVIDHKDDVMACELETARQKFEVDFKWIKMIGDLLESPEDFGLVVDGG